MIRDLDLEQLSDISNGLYDACVVGAGVAGITLAMELSKKGKNVILIEGGGKEETIKSQEIYGGLVTGDPYFDLSVGRLRFLGGSSNHWGGWSRSFEEIDFKRDYLGEEYK